MPPENATPLPQPGKGTGRPSAARYLSLLWSFARYCLIRELSFRGNFLSRCVVEVSWLIMLIAFFELIFMRTEHIGDWGRYEYLFFMGTAFILDALVGAIFMDNCANLTELIRTGDLDFALTKPIDEQFLLSLQRFDWASVPNVFVGIVLLARSMMHTGSVPTVEKVAGYILLLIAGLAILYSLMITMAASSVWIIRSHGLYEIWFYVTQFARYPAEIYSVNIAGRLLRFVLTFMLPVLLAVNVPARFGAKAISWEIAAYLFFAAAVCLAASRWFFRFALRRYRSASS